MKMRTPTDIETLFYGIIRNISATERGIMIDIKATGEAYGEGATNYIIWIGKDCSLADEMTKSKILSQLVDVTKIGERK